VADVAVAADYHKCHRLSRQRFSEGSSNCP
jgi:hypothetical protein